MMVAFLITLGFIMTFMLILYKVMLKKQNSGKPFNCGAEVCFRDKIDNIKEKNNIGKHHEY